MKATWPFQRKKYLLLTEFEGRTVSYGPSFFLEGEKTGKNLDL